MSHHYDEHDHDKLLRWREDLRGAAIDGDGFPAMALFLVKPQATGSHEIFRRYRAEFEQRDARLCPPGHLRDARRFDHRKGPAGADRPGRKTTCR